MTTVLEQSAKEALHRPRPAFRHADHPLVRLAALDRPFDKYDACDILQMTPNHAMIHLAKLNRAGKVERTPLGTQHNPKYLVLKEASPELFTTVRKAAPVAPTAVLAPRDIARLNVLDAFLRQCVEAHGCFPSDGPVAVAPQTVDAMPVLKTASELRWFLGWLAGYAMARKPQVARELGKLVTAMEKRVDPCPDFAERVLDLTAAVARDTDTDGLGRQFARQ